MIKSNSSLPIGFEKLKTEKNYVNLSKLPEGEHKFRIVQRPIAGWIDWKDNKPFRYRPDSRPNSSFDPERPIKAFWALHVWDYAREGLYIMEVTQNGIRKSLENYALNEDWGDLTSFDIKIKKEGVGKDTNYTVIPIPPKPMAANIKRDVEATQIRLEALYDGKDPWKDLADSLTECRVEIQESRLTEEQRQKLADAVIDMDDEEDMNRLCNRLGVVSIFEIGPEDFDRVIRSIAKKIAEKKLKKMEEESA